MGRYDFGWHRYVPVAARRAQAARAMQKLRKKGQHIEPIEIEGRKIARTFWGQAWCEHLEKFSDYANRLPRGRTYVRNGSVCHLAISTGKVEAIVSGTELYNIKINISPLSKPKWKNVQQQCAGQIGTMLELLQGRFSTHVMAVVTDRSNGLFPDPKEITLNCDCPDWAMMCKHVAAALYGIGARLDNKPELLFRLRNVDQQALIGAELALTSSSERKGKRRRLATQDLGAVFGIDIDETPDVDDRPTAGKASTAKGVTKKASTGKGTTMNSSEAKGTAKAKKVSTPKGKVIKASTSKGMAKKVSMAKGSVTTKRAFTPTAPAIRRMRRRLRMNQSQFASLIGVSAATIAKWESSTGRLNLHQRTLQALIGAAERTADQARKRI